MRLPATIVTVARPAASGTQRPASGPTPSKYTRTSATKPAALGATLSHATNGVGAASYVSGTHMWNGKAAILKPNPTNAATRPSTSRGSPPGSARATPPRLVVRAAPYTKDSPYAITADDTLPTRKNFSAASTAVASRLANPEST